MLEDTSHKSGSVEDLTKSSLMLVTANVGSLFEDPTRLLTPWLQEFLLKVSQLQPQFLALHLQEVGGKTYEKSMEYVQRFIKCLCEAEEIKEYSTIRIYMDEDFNSIEHFTALGNLYFVHNSLQNIRLWNFLTHEWEVAIDKNIYSGNIETIATKEKSKFPQHFFPECKWSRKGFMRTRWDINGTIFDLVNIHLFHDASNLAACEEFPSVYCKTRRRALVHTLERLHLDVKNGLVPFFVFGDFNFRCDTGGVIKELTENLTIHRVQSIKNDSTKVHYRNSDGDNILTVGKKEFNHADHQLKFKENWLKKYDKELLALDEILIEYPINFPPSYPYEEDPEMPTDYMSTRCPSWCDRILMSPQARDIIDEITQISYNIIGENICMGDHKPIYLSIHIKPNQGTYRCCKCYFNNTNNNTSYPAAPSTAISPTIENFIHCPYNSHIFNEVLTECKKMKKSFNDKNDNTKQQSQQKHQIINDENNIESNIPRLHESSQNSDNVLITTKYPTVSINVIDSDNICVCNCVQLTNSNDNDAVDGSICCECQNIIKKQPIEHRYRLVSKRLILSDNIIVNRIDAQYLNTYSDIRQQRDDCFVYTPESIESHSPYPEMNSTTTTSSNSRAILFDQFSKSQTIAIDATNDKSNNLNALNIDSTEKQHRGVVSPVQLKSRLEDLQKSSMHTININCNAAGDIDVDNNNRQTANTHTSFNNCFTECCSIN